MVPGWRQKSRCFLPSWGISSSSTITFQLAAAALLFLVVVSSIACGIRLSSIINYYLLSMLHMALWVVDHLSILPACFFNLPQESLWSGSGGLVEEIKLWMVVRDRRSCYQGLSYSQPVFFVSMYSQVPRYPSQD